MHAKRRGWGGKRPGSGRPRSAPDGDARSQEVRVKVTSHEKAQMVRKAHRGRLTVPEWLRRLAASA